MLGEFGMTGWKLRADQLLLQTCVLANQPEEGWSLSKSAAAPALGIVLNGKPWEHDST
jgi:hypothetical protein